MINNPVNRTDPTGHKDCSGSRKSGDDCVDVKTSLKKDIEAKYAVKIKGGWKEDELAILGASLDKMASYVGGDENLNAAFIAGAQSHNKDAYAITLLRVQTYSINPNTTNPNGPSAAGWSNNSDATISFGSAVFDPLYHNGRCQMKPKGPAYTRPSSISSYELSAQFTIAHEFGHVLADAAPAALSIYTTASPSKGEEDMANEIAVHAISQGTITSTFSQKMIDAGIWNYNYP